MKNRIDSFFDKKDEKALICYFPVGDPNFDSLKVVETYINAGADILEIGLPSLNPYLDGKLVSESMRRTLASKTIQDCCDIIVEIRKKFPNAALQVMCYMDLFDSITVADFNQFAKESELDGLLVADATMENLQFIRSNLKENISIVNFLPYSSSKELLQQINAIKEGYIFLQATDGSTGMRSSVDTALVDKIKTAKNVFGNFPICAGFGISKPDHCKEIITMGADGVIIGSAILNKIDEGQEALTNFIRECKENM